MRPRLATTPPITGHRSLDALGQATTTAYDGVRRPAIVTDALGHTTSIAYDANGNRWTTTDALNRATTYTYDAMNRFVTVTDATGGRARYAYDAVGNRMSMTDPNGTATTTTYDVLNRPTSELDPLTNTASTSYDAVGNSFRTHRRQWRHHDVQLRRAEPPRDDCVHRRHCHERVQRGGQPQLGHRLGRGHSVDVRRGATVTATTAGAATTEYRYDAAGNLTRLTNPDATRVDYVYDAAGRQTSATDGTGRTAAYSYDNAYRRTSEDLPERRARRVHIR